MTTISFHLIEGANCVLMVRGRSYDYTTCIKRAEMGVRIF
jgi:hypothetical protein